MQQKDYKAIAEILRKYKNNMPIEVRDDLIQDFIIYFKKYKFKCDWHNKETNEYCYNGYKTYFHETNYKLKCHKCNGKGIIDFNPEQFLKDCGVN